jgi:hypothetical protein
VSNDAHKDKFVVRLYCVGISIGYDILCKFSTLCGVWEFYGGNYIECYPLGSDIIAFCKWVFFFEGHCACVFRVEEILVMIFAFMIQLMCLDLLERVLVFCSCDEMFSVWCCIHSQLILLGKRQKYTWRWRQHISVKYYMKLQIITSTLNIYIPLDFRSLHNVYGQFF